jgi:serine protease Do
MKRFIRKSVLWLATIFIVTMAMFSFTGCNFVESDVTADALINAREEIRQSNIAIDTLYYQDKGWYSRNTGSGMGSGVVFYETDTTYYALTNYHVITQVLYGKTCTTSYTITDINGVTYDGKVEKEDSGKDIAIVSFEKSNKSVLKTINYTARIDTNVTIGEFVLAVGNPSGVKNIVTYGKINGIAYIKNVDYMVINHNALINPGNSGGALCDIDGNLLGINTWGTDGADDDNYAIPLSVINEFVVQFLTEKFLLKV